MGWRFAAGKRSWRRSTPGGVSTISRSCQRCSSTAESAFGCSSAPTRPATQSIGPAGGAWRMAVHLDETRCDGQGHGGCQAGCLLFWKEAWLKRVAAPQQSPSVPHETQHPSKVTVGRPLHRRGSHCRNESAGTGGRRRNRRTSARQRYYPPLRRCCPGGIFVNTCRGLHVRQRDGEGARPRSGDRRLLLSDTLQQATRTSVRPGAGGTLRSLSVSRRRNALSREDRYAPGQARTFPCPMSTFGPGISYVSTRIPRVLETSGRERQAPWNVLRLGGGSLLRRDVSRPNGGAADHQRADGPDDRASRQ